MGYPSGVSKRDVNLLVRRLLWYAYMIEAEFSDGAVWDERNWLRDQGFDVPDEEPRQDWF